MNKPLPTGYARTVLIASVLQRIYTETVHCVSVAHAPWTTDSLLAVDVYARLRTSVIWRRSVPTPIHRIPMPRSRLARLYFSKLGRLLEAQRIKFSAMICWDSCFSPINALHQEEILKMFEEAVKVWRTPPMLYTNVLLCALISLVSVSPQVLRGKFLTLLSYCIRATLLIFSCLWPVQ